VRSWSSSGDDGSASSLGGNGALGGDISANSITIDSDLTAGLGVIAVVGGAGGSGANGGSGTDGGDSLDTILKANSAERGIRGVDAEH